MSASCEPVVLDLPSEAGVLSVVRAALRAIAEDAALVRLDGRELDEVAVAVQEACTNAIRHAHRGDASRRFQVELLRRDDALEVRVKDGGEPFDLDAFVAPPPEALSEGGYGIGIMRSWMDEVTLEREGGRNVLRLVRRYRVAAGDDRVRAR